MNQLIELCNRHLASIFAKDSYKMSNLMRFFDIIITRIAFNMDDDKSKIDLLTSFKTMVIDANRCVKDQMEFQGRMQVKVINSNFLSKCDHFLREYTSQSNKFAELILNVKSENSALEEKMSSFKTKFNKIEN